ncbi:MAG: diguanylate cyclase [Usitatibacteraceae bacterium]
MARSTLSLRQVLTLPYVVLTLLVAGIIGGFSYLAGSQAVSAVSEELLRDMVSRISQAVDRHLVGSRVALDAVFPDGGKAPLYLESESESLRNRMWVATGLNPDPNNYVYYGNTRGQFAGVVRNADGSGEWRSGHSATTPRGLQRFAGLNAPLEKAFVESRLYDARQRPWYQKAIAAKKPVWSPVYVDNRTGELVATRTKPVLDEAGQIEGVGATDVSLKMLNDFVRALHVSQNGVAFVAEQNGDLIASTSDDSTRLSNGQKLRLNAAQSGNALVRATYAEVADVFKTGLKNTEPQARMFDGPDGKVYASVNVIRDNAGLEWITVVAVPRADFMAGVIDNVKRSVTVAVVAALLAMALGLWVLNWVSHDLRLLSTAARRLGEGHLFMPVGIARKDELGELARNFEVMQLSLQTDKLTGVFNRDTFEKQVTRRIEEFRSGLRKTQFSLLFVDLDHFKRVNDQLGHQVGDIVLTELAERLKHALRSGDIVGRYGGDEFVVLLSEIESVAAAERVREKIEARMREPLTSVSADVAAKVRVSASIGMATYPAAGPDVSTLLAAADKEMYERKQATRPAV